jgi:hypothetical protein
VLNYLSEVRVMERSILTIDIEDAFRTGKECPLCYLIERDENRFLQAFFSEWVMDPWSRDKIISSRGFCRYHSHQILRFAEAHSEKLGLALVLQNVVHDRLQTIENLCKNSDSLINVLRCNDLKSILERRLLGKNPESLRRFARKVVARLGYVEAQCPACLHLLESNASHIETFIQMIVQSETFNDVLKESRGLCLPHLVEVTQVASRRLDQRSFASVLKTILPIEASSFTRIKFELSEFIMKHDYRFAKERFGSEVDVVERGILKLIGTSHLGPIPVKSESS